MTQLSISSVELVSASDPELDGVFGVVAHIPDLEAKLAGLLRRALDEVIDGPRTGRYRVDQLEKTEKTYIGTKVEILLRYAFGFDRGAKLDNLIAGQEVDTKFSLSGNWMIPSEAKGHICLLISADDEEGVFSIGLIRITDNVISTGTNRDKKATITKSGRNQIRWIFRDSKLPPNFLMILGDDVANQILSASSGVRRLELLFTSAKNVLIPREVIEHVGQQKDALKRAREQKSRLLEKGVLVLCAKYSEDLAQMRERGFEPNNRTDWLSVDV